MKELQCPHLAPLWRELRESGAKETTRGQVWTENCREWVYFDVVLDVESLQQRMSLPDCVRVHENKDQKSGAELGFYCEECQDAVMGLPRAHEVKRFG